MAKSKINSNFNCSRSEIIRSREDYCDRCGTQGEYGGLRIGVGFVGLGEVVLESGVHEQHRVADLWLYYRDDSSKNTKVQVHIGQRVTIGKYAFLVTDMRGGKGSVELQFETDP